METYRAALIGCSRMGAFIDNEGSKPLPPYSHAASYEACPRTQLIACSDLRPEVMEEVGIRYGVPKNAQYTDYRKMIDSEQPDIVSIATQPEQRAEIVIYAAQNGAKAIYAEKAMAASMDEAKRMVEAVENRGVAFNLGTNRRWESGFDTMKEVVREGKIGQLRSIILYDSGSLFNAASHSFDLAFWLNDDQSAISVQANLPDGDSMINDDLLTEDPLGEGIIRFENGVTAYSLLTGRRGEFGVTTERGTLRSLSNGDEWEMRCYDSEKLHIDNDHCSPTDLFPDFTRRSSSLRIVEDLVHSLDTGQPTRGGVRTAYKSTELIFAFIESHIKGGSRVDLPLNNSKIRLHRGHRKARLPVFKRVNPY